MREIKIRLWDIENKKMLYYDKHIVPDMTLNGVLIDGNGSNVSYKYKKMQHTGLKDKNGKEIYEGDIIRTKKGYYCKVVWHIDFAEFRIIYPGSKMAIISFDSEVVGNIYDNKDLLK